MRRILLLLALIGSAAAQSVSIGGTVQIGGTVNVSTVAAGGGGGGSCGATYSIAVPLVLATAASSDLSNFAYPYSISYKALATVANGGSVNNTVTDARGRTRPADIKICTASSGGSALKFYIPEWDATTGNNTQIVILEAPLHTSTNDVPWLLIGNAAVTADPYDYSLITDASISDWCHGESFNCDVNNGTSSGSSPTANVAGQVGGALSLTRANGDYVTLASPAWSGGNNVTVMGWLKPSGAGGFSRILSNLNSSGNNGWLFSLTNSNGPMLYEDSAGTVHSYSEGCGGLPISCGTTDWYHQAFTANGTTISGYIFGDLINTGTAGAIGSPSQNMLIGNNADGTGVKWDGLLDELLWAPNVWSADKISTLWGIQRYAGFSKIFDVSGVNPAVRQITGCASKFDTGLVSVCTLPTQTTSASNHYIVAISAQIDGASCNTAPTSLLGLTYTRQAKDDYTGTIHHYYTCIYTAPITTSGTEVLTWPAGNTGELVFEVWNVTASGIVTTTAGHTAGPPAAMSATSPGADSFLLCGTKGNTASTPTSNSEGYTDMFAPVVLNTDHPALAYAAWGNVGTGTKTCTLAGTFSDTGVMVIMPKN